MGTVLMVLAARLVRAPLHTTYVLFVLLDSLGDHRLAGMLLQVLGSTSAEVDTTVVDTAVMDTAVGMQERLAGKLCMDTYCPY